MMDHTAHNTPTYSAFAGPRRMAQGTLAEVALIAQTGDEAAWILVFDDETGRQVELDLRGTPAEMLARLPEAPAQEPRGRGRPKLGVVPREVTLLPRHWDWLNAQPGGASVALRKLVDEARHTHEAADRLREGREALYRFASVMAGNAPGYEEAIRALYADDRPGFERLLDAWPADVADHCRRMAAAAFA